MTSGNQDSVSDTDKAERIGFMGFIFLGMCYEVSISILFH